MYAYLCDSHLVVLSGTSGTPVLAFDQDVIWNWRTCSRKLGLLIEFEARLVVPVSDWYSAQILIVVGRSRAVLVSFSGNRLTICSATYNDDGTDNTLSILRTPM